MTIPQREPTEQELGIITELCAELDSRYGMAGDPRVNLPPRPCFVLPSRACTGATVATLRWADCLPPWVRCHSVVWARAAAPAGAREVTGIGPRVVRQRPLEVTHWLLGASPGFQPPAERTAVLVHTADVQYTSQAFASLRGAGVLAVSAASLRAHESWVQEQQHRVLGVLPPVYPVQTRAAARGVGERIRAVFVGRPSAAKGFHLLPRLLKLMPELVVTAYVGGDQGCAGTPEETEAVRRTMQVAERMRVADRLVLGSYCNPADGYAPVYANQDVLLLLSLTESQPLVVGEALSCGVPVVATAVGGIPEVLREGVAGVLVPSPDVAGWDLAWVVDAIRAAMACDAQACQDSVAHLSRGAWVRAHRPLLMRFLGAEVPQAPDARVTVVVQVPRSPQELQFEWLDACVASVAGQTYRQARVVLECDGDEAMRGTLAQRYELPVVVGGASSAWTEYEVEVPYGLRLCRDYLAQVVAAMDALQIPALRSPVIMLAEDTRAAVAGQEQWAPAEGTTMWCTAARRTGYTDVLVNAANSLVAGRRFA